MRPDNLDDYAILQALRVNNVRLITENGVSDLANANDRMMAMFMLTMKDYERSVRA
jgi:DNA invertase Pin-like site-specific DNA recombinase